MLKLLPIALTFTLFGVPSRATSVDDAPPAAEFPPQDMSLAFSVNTGFYKARAARLSREAPATVEAVRALAIAQDVEGSLRSLRLILEQHPEQLAEAVEAFRDRPLRAFGGHSEQVRRHQEALRQFLADARAILPSLPREAAARAERMFIILDGLIARERQQWREVLARFIERYRGTETALLAEVDLIMSGSGGEERLKRLDVFAAQHPGTAAAAKALYQKGWDLHTINTLGTIYPHDADPIERFRRVKAIATELRSGKYPDSEWVSKAPSLITGFFVSERMKMAPASVDEIIAAYEDVARQNLVLGTNWSPLADGLRYLLTTKIPDLYQRKGSRVAGTERTFDMLERTVADKSGARLLRAQFYLTVQRDESDADREARVAKARTILRQVASEGRSAPHRRALATLAALDFERLRYADARAAFREYVKAYPSTSWTWVARIRIGHCDEGLGDPVSAAAAYLHAASSHGDMPLARVLGAVYAARALELTGDLKTVLGQYERALAGWDDAYGESYSTYLRRSPDPDDPFDMPVDSALVTKASLAPRIAQVKRALGAVGGAMLERARALIARERHADAEQELQRMLTRHPHSPLAAEARQRMHLARVESALQVADVRRPDSNAAKALQVVEALLNEAPDFGVTAAKIMRATLLLKSGQQADAERALATALSEWHERQPIRRPATPLEEDVAGIRRAVFLPLGGDIYKQGWNAFHWPDTLPPFLLTRSGIRVKPHHGSPQFITLTEPLPGTGKALFLDDEQIALLKKMIAALGGTKRRAPSHIMETPNQPIGDSTQILAFWNRFFPARPGHWGGWELETYPVITEIAFVDPERTKATAKVTIGYSGATVELDKEAGTWIAKRLTGFWIT